MARERLEWKKSTCYTVLKKLEAKGFVKNEDATVTSLIGREQVQRAESSQLIERSFGGSLPAFLNAFLSGRRLTAEEARELPPAYRGSRSRGSARLRRSIGKRREGAYEPV